MAKTEIRCWHISKLSSVAFSRSCLDKAAEKIPWKCEEKMWKVHAKFLFPCTLGITSSGKIFGKTFWKMRKMTFFKLSFPHRWTISRRDSLKNRLINLITYLKKSFLHLTVLRKTLFALQSQRVLFFFLCNNMLIIPKKLKNATNKIDL